MARDELRPVIELRSTAGTGYTYATRGNRMTRRNRRNRRNRMTRRNRRHDPNRLALRKYGPVAGQHVDFREER
ncbi:50S ribosomal protein L33 [Streptomyces sp. NRRL S-350]|uniref:50S ribosomal protein L33 n=1 Tax=Streptomyces sp. NRRL S-350 TaxID=1463902 RepID=UPI0004BF4872|nr:50S ribosomal protein L33 [Streptomyces sp. NRRL S-350]